MAAHLRDIHLLSKLDSANEIFYHSKCQEPFDYRYIQFIKTGQEINNDWKYEKAIVLEKTIDFLKKIATENPDEVRRFLDVYNTNLDNKGFNQKENNITRFGNLVLNHCDAFAIHRNSRNTNVFIRKKEYVKSTAPNDFDPLMQ